MTRCITIKNKKAYKYRCNREITNSFDTYIEAGNIMISNQSKRQALAARLSFA